MNIFKKQLLWIIPLLILAQGLFAQQGSIAIMEYIDGDPEEVVVTLPSGEEEWGYIGMELDLESTIQTGYATVEIRLDPNGTIFNLDEDTLFVLNSIQGRRGSDETTMTLIQGKLRTVAARSGVNNNYTVRTPSAVCGIRGTEIMNIITAEEKSILCKSGSVEVISTSNPLNSSVIGANQRINTQAVQYIPVQLPAEEMSQLFNALPFKELSPQQVPGHVEDSVPAEPEEIITEEAPPAEEPNAEEQTPPEETAQANQTEEENIPVVEETPVEEPEEIPEDNQESRQSRGGNRSVAGPPAVPTEEGESDGQDRADREPSKLEEWFSESMGFEIGAVTIDGVTYSKVIAQPIIKTDKLTLGLYLPIIYKETLLDPDYWYKPEGNNEWSFGSDQKDWEDIIFDFSSDLFLKIRYMEYGDPNWDRFYVKVGNLETMQLGHGSLVYNYSNNTNFPSERLVGLNMGVTFSDVKFETLLDDAANPSLIGGRVQIRSGKPLAVGLAGVVDLYPLAESLDQGNEGYPYIIGTSLDLEFFRFDLDILKLLTYADASTTLLMFRSNPSARTVEDYTNPLQLVSDGNYPRNYGFKGGVLGEIGPLDFTLDMRYENGIYKHNLFDNLYQRNRQPRIKEMLDYLENPVPVASSLGIFGEAGFSVFQEKVRFSAAYLWPWEIEGSTIDSITMTSDDYFKMGLELEKGLVPVYDVSGAIFYERANFYNSLLNDDFTFFNADTQLSGEVVMPLAPTLDLAVVVSTTTVYDEEGILVMENGIPKIVPVFNIETRIHF